MNWQRVRRWKRYCGDRSVVNMRSKKRPLKKILATTWMTVGVLFILWLVYSYQAHGVGDQLLESSSTVETSVTSDYYLFTPTKAFQNVFIFYPGALVDPKAYVPLCRKLAEHGIKAYLVKMPWRLASQGYNKPIALHLFDDSSKTYTLSGHSQGGKMAAQFVYEHPGVADKLILIGTSHPRDISLASSTIPVLKISGSKDGVADERSISENKPKFPSTTVYDDIPGANHSQFGYYGFQLGDNRSDISRERQQSETLQCILAFINK